MSIEERAQEDRVREACVRRRESPADHALIGISEHLLEATAVGDEVVGLPEIKSLKGTFRLIGICLWDPRWVAEDGSRPLSCLDGVSWWDMLAAMNSAGNQCQTIQWVIGKHARFTALGHLGAILAGTLFCSSLPGADSPTTKFRIASGVQSKAEIVVEAEKPELPLAFAAQELQRYVKAMSGAELPVVRAPSQKPAIVR